MPGDQARRATQRGRPACDFDFLFGSWHVRHRYLVDRLVGCTDWVAFDGRASCRPILEGIGNIDEILMPSRGVTGVTVMLCDVDSGAWSIRWTSTSTGRFESPVYGSFHGQCGVFEGDDVFNGMHIRVRYVWDEISTAYARWRQAFSFDAGMSWEENWVMRFARRQE